MNLLYEETLDGISVQRCYGLDGIVQIPDTIEGKPVTGLASYLFSETVRGRQVPPSVYEGEPEICGSQVKELTLPVHVKRIGAYAFYNCSGLRKLSCHSTIADWGAGVFTGCSGITSLSIQVAENCKSCLREILSELRQTLDVDYRDGAGNLLCRLVFPEYFEESVENTPARIILRQMHGCGHLYRYCFEETRFQVGEYDKLFPHVVVQELPGLVTRLALYRLYRPWGLKEEAARGYREYVAAHAEEAAAGLFERGERDILGWLAREPYMNEAALRAMLKAAARSGDAGDAALLMDVKHKRFGHVPSKARTFEL